MSSSTMTEEFEKVQIGNCQIRLPSTICSDQNTFQSIFSLETWNNVLEPEQRERILEMLPPEVLSIPGAGLKTMEDLLSGNLVRFGLSPLETFFSELNIGGFDPEVVKMKTGIKKHWRRDLLRRRKIYHTKLLQEVIISTETHLKQLTDKKALHPIPNNTKAPKPVKACNQNSTKTKKPQKSGATKSTPLRKRVAKRLHDEIAAINQAFNYSLSSSDEELPVTKKPLQISKKSPKPATKAAPKKVTPKSGSKAAKVTALPVKAAETSPTPTTRPMPTLTAIRTTSVMSAPSLASIPSSSNLMRPTSGSVVLKIQEEQTTLTQTQTKFSRNPPPPYTAICQARTSTLTSTSPSTVIANNQKPLQSKPTSSTPNPVQIQLHSNNPIKSSPILASQLQAPISSPATKLNFATELASRTKPNPVVHQEVNKIRTGISDFPSQVMKLCLKSDDEMESSSEDEFEAIEPTIGFSTQFPLLPNVSKIHQTKLTPKITTSRFLSQGTNHKILPAKPKQVLYTVPKISGSLTSASNTMTLNKSIQNVHQLVVGSNTKVANSHILLTSPSISANKNPSTAPSLKVISSPSEPYSLVPVAHSTPVSSTSVTSTAKLTTNLILTPNNTMVSATLVPISVQQGGLTKLQSVRHPGAVFPANSTGVAILNGPSSTSTSCVSNNPLNNVTTSTVNCASTTPNNILQTNKNSTPIIATTSVMPHTHIVPTLNNAIRSSTHLPLTLTDISLSLGLDVGVDSKLGLDKIDDLSVLDGNPFDSIPNLSDELDGFDLDLVDGLCDFEGLLSEEKQYASFFSLIREVLCSTQYHRMTLVCLEKTIRKWAVTPTAALNAWFMRVNDWNEILITALNFLAGNYQDVHPEDFVPYIEYKYKTKYYQWIGAGRDSDTNLLQLCNMWLENLDRLPPLKKQDGENEEQEEEDDDNEDSDDHAEEVKKKYMRPKTPPPPRFITEWTVRPSTTEEKEDFQEQERFRFDNPHKAFTYRMHEYESVVGPVKGVYSSQSGVTNKARGHSLLVDDRPPYVTILALVRDSVARLPNGEGTRSEICEMLRDSAFLAPEASNVTLNSVVSGALDRLHYERDPCVRYDSHKKNWIYLHRDRSQEQFERLHHNRSYTKSTKSRNSSSRKSRKKTTSQSSSVGQINSINQTNTGNDSSSTVPSSSSSVSSTPASTPNLNLKSANPSTPASAPSLIPTTNKSSGSDSVLISETETEKLTTPPLSGSDGNHSPVCAPVPQAPTTIQFTLPVSSGTSKTWSQALDPSKAQTFVQIQNLPNSSQTFTTMSNSNQTPSGKFVGALRQPVSSGTNVINVVANHATVASTSNQQNIQFPSGQFIFGSNAVLRLSSNLRLPEGVRFTQLRLPVQQNSTGQAAGNSVRLGQSQHRILLTRGAFPGQTPQGVLLGQTASGQTLFLSTAAPIGNLQSQSGAPINSVALESNQPQQQKNAGYENKPPTLFSHNSDSSSSALAVINPSVTTSSTNVTVPNSISTIPVTPQFHSQGMTKKIAVTANGSHAPTVVNSSVTTCGTLSQKMNPYQVSNATMQDQNQPFQQVQHLGQNVVSVAQVQAQIQQQSSTGSGPAPQLTSPFILRSNQGDFMIPGHISLGRGMQGIKVIPVPSGKQTVLARLVNPSTNQTQPPALHNHASQQ